MGNGSDAAKNATGSAVSVGSVITAGHWLNQAYHAVANTLAKLGYVRGSMPASFLERALRQFRGFMLQNVPETRAETTAFNSLDRYICSMLRDLEAMKIILRLYEPKLRPGQGIYRRAVVEDLHDTLLEQMTHFKHTNTGDFRGPTLQLETAYNQAASVIMLFGLSGIHFARGYFKGKKKSDESNRSVSLKAYAAVMSVSAFGFILFHSQHADVNLAQILKAACAGAVFAGGAALLSDGMRAVIC